MSKWYVVRSATRQEGRAMASLNELGFETYLPMMTRWHRSGREKRAIQSPLFVGYLFASLEEGDFWDASIAEGVHQILRSRGGVPTPISVPYGVIATIMDQEAAGEYDKTRRTKPDPSAGAKVHITSGKFQGFPAEFVARRDEERVEVMFQMLGKWSPLVLKSEEVAGMSEEAA